MSERGDDRPPWKKKKPKAGARKKLSGGQRAEARARARAAGRPYPNLVDNMAVARKTKKAPERKPAAKRKAASAGRSITRKTTVKGKRARKKIRS